jgi:hypothetical protein
MTIARNRSLDYRHHIGLMQKWAVKFHSRLVAAGLGVEFDDVMGELRLAFVKSSQGYDPERGYTFTAFLQQCCQNHFNKYANRLMLEQFGCSHADDAAKWAGKQGLGLISVQAIEAANPDPDGGSFYDGVEDETYATPEQLIEAGQTVRDLIGDGSLLPETRAYIARLINPDVEIGDVVRERILARQSEVKKQIKSRWGISLASLNL